MLLLALDTTTAAGSVALWRGGLIEERAGDAARSHAERLPGDLVALLAAHGHTTRDVERYAVASGPGSFTGLRIGIATVQGLALVGERLVHAEGTLDLLAHDAARAADAEAGTTIVAWMEAYRGEVFAARYRVVAAAPVDADGTRRRGAATLEALDAPVVSAPEPLAEAWGHGASGRVIVIGDGVPRTRALLVAHFGAAAALREPGPLAGTLAALAARQTDSATRPHAVMPIYVRRPDAELARDRAAVRPTA
jgi:tRNA threonylcarbamoyladenosine biosynthesis protein TsaB